MTEADVWNILNRAADRSHGDEELAIDFVQASLEDLPADQLIAYTKTFERLRDQLMHARLYGVLWLLNGVSGDAPVLDLAAWIMLQGQAVYERTKQDYDSLADLECISNERSDYGATTGEILAYLPYEIHAEKVGTDFPFFTGLNVPEAAFAEEMPFEDPVAMEQLFPRLWKKLGGFNPKCFEEETEVEPDEDPAFTEWLDTMLEQGDAPATSPPPSESASDAPPGPPQP